MNPYTDEAVKAGWKYFCDDVPVESQNVVDFWQEIKLKMPELVIVQGTWRVTRTATNLSSIQVFAGVDVAHARYPKEIVGAIGYQKYEEKYAVESRLIANARFGQWNSDHRTQKSKHMNKLFKVAKNVLVPKQLHEVYNDSFNRFLQKIANIRNGAVDGLRDHVNCVSMFEWRQELLNMAQVGYMPKNGNIRKAMEYVTNTQEEFDHKSKYSPPTGFIWIKSDGVAFQKFSDSHAKQDGEPVEVSSTDELPESIREKLFVLMIANESVFIEEVGMKVSDNKFWVIL